MHHIRKMHCQQITLNYITLAYEILQAKPVLSPGLISKRYFEFVRNKHSNIPSVWGPGTMYLLDPPLIGPVCQSVFHTPFYEECPATFAFV